MGECAFYLTVTFPSADTAAEKALPIKGFLEAVGKAYWDWQDSRNNADISAFYKRHQRLLQEFGFAEAPTNHNAFAGILESPASDPDWQFKVDGQTIKAEGILWHFANLDPLAKALERWFPSAKVEWTSEEAVFEAELEAKEAEELN